jgi:hypothetical protein
MAERPMNRKLDCNTPRGRVWVEKQREAVRECEKAWGVAASQTPDDRESPVDVLFTRDGAVTMIAEVKARDMSMAQLQRFGSYLVTLEKLKKGAAMAKQLCVPYRLIVKLTDATVWWDVADSEGRKVVELDRRRTLTQATCNGGQANRVNAYLSLARMRQLEPPQPKAHPPVEREQHADDLRWD